MRPVRGSGDGTSAAAGCAARRQRCFGDPVTRAHDNDAVLAFYRHIRSCTSGAACQRRRPAHPRDRDDGHPRLGPRRHSGRDGRVGRPTTSAAWPPPPHDARPLPPPRPPPRLRRASVLRMKIRFSRWRRAATLRCRCWSGAPHGTTVRATATVAPLMRAIAICSAWTCWYRPADARRRRAACQPARRRCAVVGSADHGLKVFDLASMRDVKTLYTRTCGHAEWVTACRFLSDRRVLSGGMDAKLCLWSDVTRGGPARCVDLLGHTGSISQVEVSEAGGRARAISASYDRTLRIWELSSSSSGGGGREVGRLAGHKGPVTHFSWVRRRGPLRRPRRHGEAVGRADGAVPPDGVLQARPDRLASRTSCTLRSATSCCLATRAGR